LFFLEEEDFGDRDGEVLRAIPVEDLDGGTAIEEVVSDDDSRAEEVEEGIDAEVNYCDGKMMVGVAPLEVMIATGKERRMGESLIKGGEGPVIGVVDKTIARAIDL